MITLTSASLAAAAHLRPKVQAPAPQPPAAAPAAPERAAGPRVQPLGAAFAAVILPTATAAETAPVAQRPSAAADRTPPAETAAADRGDAPDGDSGLDQEVEAAARETARTAAGDDLSARLAGAA